LSDPTEDIRVATENLLDEFLHEIGDVSDLHRRLQEQGNGRLLLENEKRILEDDNQDYSPGYFQGGTEKADVFGNDGDQRSVNGELAKEGVDNRDTGGEPIYCVDVFSLV
jgi:hypothetical protein